MSDADQTDRGDRYEQALDIIQEHGQEINRLRSEVKRKDADLARLRGEVERLEKLKRGFEIVVTDLNREVERLSNGERCAECNAELSYCGEMTADGPSLDCKQCRLTRERDEWRKAFNKAARQRNEHERRELKALRERDEARAERDRLSKLHAAATVQSVELLEENEQGRDIFMAIRDAVGVEAGDGVSILDHVGRLRDERDEARDVALTVEEHAGNNEALRAENTRLRAELERIRDKPRGQSDGLWTAGYNAALHEVGQTAAAALTDPETGGDDDQRG